MRKKYYIGHLVDGFNDGGQSRNKAFMRAFVSKKAVAMSVYNEHVLLRFLYSLNVLKFMLFSKNNQIFIHQGTLLVLFPIPLIKYNRVRKWAFQFLQYIINRNEVTIEVNDLPYEQSKDLELTVRQVDKDFQDNLYSLQNAKYVFASHEMGRYINEKYKLDYEVVINGSDPVKDFSDLDLPSCFNSSETKFIYAGGLNKGRQIELLISKFYNKKEILILIGEWGEWLLDHELSSNIFYLGKFKEDYAHYLASKCDVGLIPYDEDRFYYTICYPTKASFYITAGIPFLSTPLLELENVFGKSGMVYFVPMRLWDNFIENYDKSSLFGLRKTIECEKHKFHWEELLSNYLTSS